MYQKYECKSPQDTLQHVRQPKIKSPWCVSSVASFPPHPVRLQDHPPSCRPRPRPHPASSTTVVSPPPDPGPRMSLSNSPRSIASRPRTSSCRGLLVVGPVGPADGRRDGWVRSRSRGMRAERRATSHVDPKPMSTRRAREQSRRTLDPGRTRFPFFAPAPIAPPASRIASSRSSSAMGRFPRRDVRLSCSAFVMASVSGRRTGEDGTNASGSELEGNSFIGEGDFEEGMQAWTCVRMGVGAGGWA